MDVSRPERSLIPTLDGAVLLALSGTSGTLTAPHIHRIAGTGSVNGVRRVLARLVTEGLVLTEQAGQVWLYRANHEHVAWPAVIALTQLRAEFFTRLRQALAALDPQCVYAGLFGSAARGDGTAESDIDLLLIHPDDIYSDRQLENSWTTQVFDLGEQVQRWTGNELEIFAADVEELTTWPMGDPMLVSLRRDLIDLFGRSTWDKNGRLQVAP